MKKAAFFFTLSLMTMKVMSQVSAGPKLQLNLANVMGGENSAYNKFKLGYNAGGFINVPVTEKIDLHGEALYSTRGFIMQHSIGAKDSNITHRLTYIDFPVLGLMHIGDNGFIETGPQIGFLANDRMKGSVVSSSVIQEVDTGIVYGLRTTEYSLVIGGGYNFNFKLTASVRFIYGLSKLYENTGDYSHNISFGVSLAYSFGAVASKGGGVIYKRI
jgi:hypothetical protein